MDSLDEGTGRLDEQLGVGRKKKHQLKLSLSLRSVTISPLSQVRLQQPPSVIAFQPYTSSLAVATRSENQINQYKRNPDQKSYW